MATRWMVAGCFAFALASPVRAVDSLDAIRADLANCKGPPSCLHRTLLQARLNYLLKMIQMAEVTMAVSPAQFRARVRILEGRSPVLRARSPATQDPLSKWAPAARFRPMLVP